MRSKNWGGMKLLKNYDIDISELNLGQHEFHFQVDDKFFELFDYSLLDHGNLFVHVLLDKKISFISMNFSVSGDIELVCDRSLDQFEYHLEGEHEMVLKYGEEAQELSDEADMIPYNTQRINVAKYIYEFISVDIPMKKLHPRFSDETVEDQIIYSSSDGLEETTTTDPRWSELKKLKKKE